MKHIELIEKMTLEEKIALCSGRDFWHTKAFAHLNIPSIMMSDGPHGIRKQEAGVDMLGVHNSLPSTCFPTAALSACSWDVQLLRTLGSALGKEAKHHQVSLVLGPGANIKRNPLCGRNFEYFSEDPLLSGKLAAAQIQGIESTGVGSTLKHFALNNQEYKRFASNSIIDSRAMHELYLRSFEIAVKEGKPTSVMSAYNKINGIYCSSNRWLLIDKLRNEWGFDGMVVTDWGGMSNRLKAFEAACDLCMPGGSNYQEIEVYNAVKKQILSEEHINASTDRILDLVLKKQDPPLDIDWIKHHEIARQIAEESAVLLKNDDGLLPLNEDDDLLFVGNMAKQLRYQGSGSSRINPKIQKQIVELCPDVSFVVGFDAQGNTNSSLLDEAIKAAQNAKRVVIFAGLPDSYESEGFDREHMRLPDGQNQVIEALAQINANVVVVLMSGSAIELPWADQVKAILYMGLPGQAGAEAILNLIYGKVNPSGKLAESWPIKQHDVVSDSYYAHGKKDAHYRESIYVGYRYFNTADIPVRYSFGHGLSYTQFTSKIIHCDRSHCKIQVTNTGNRKGKTVVQLYVGAQNQTFRPSLELKAFSKIELDAHQSEIIDIAIDDRFFAIYDDAWIVPRGVYTLHVGCGLDDLHDQCSLTIQSNDSIQTTNIPTWYQSPQGIPSHATWEALMGHQIVEPMIRKGSFTMENSILEMMPYSWLMRLFYKATERVIKKGFKGNPDPNDPEFKMLMSSTGDASLYVMKISGAIQNNVLEGLLSMSNGHWIKGLRLMLTKERRCKT